MYVGLTTTEMLSLQARISATGCVNYDVWQRHCQTGIENKDVDVHMYDVIFIVRMYQTCMYFKCRCSVTCNH